MADHAPILRRVANAYRESTSSVFVDVPGEIHPPTEADKEWTRRAQALLDEIATLEPEPALAALASLSLLGSFLKGAVHGIGRNGQWDPDKWRFDSHSISNSYQRGFHFGARQPQEN